MLTISPAQSFPRRKLRLLAIVVCLSLLCIAGCSRVLVVAQEEGMAESMLAREQALANALSRMEFVLVFMGTVVAVSAIAIALATAYYANIATKTAAQDFFEHRGSRLVGELLETRLKDFDEQVRHRLEQLTELTGLIKEGP